MSDALALSRRYWRYVALAALLGLALWLRWRYVREISLYVDEFTTLWAARQVQNHGAPIMPSGVLYTRGLLASYVEALFLGLFGFSYTVGRLPSVLFGLATVVAVWRIGRREWPTSLLIGVGGLAAIGLTLLPEAIVWSSRARFYAQLQFFALLTVWAAYRFVTGYGVRDSDDGDTRQSTIPNPQSKILTRPWLFVACFVLALFSQEETILLYPATLAATWWWRGWRFLLRREVLLAHLVCVAAMLVRLAIEIVGQPGYFETIQAERPYVGLAFDLVGAWRVYGPLLAAPERLPWTLAGLAATLAALAALFRAYGRLLALPRFHQATLFFALHFGFVLAVILALVGATWRESRYLFLVQPLWLLVGAAGAVWLIERAADLLAPTRRPRVATSIVVTVAAAALLGSYPAAARLFSQQVEGYDQALGLLSSVRLTGDVILSPQPPACALVLGACDYYALQRGYEEFVIPRGGVLIDRWTGSPLLNRTEQLAELIRQGPRVWFVTDSFRLATRYEPDFVNTMIDQFDLEHQRRGVMVLRAEGWRAPPMLPISRTLAPPASFAPLALTGWARNEAAPGDALHVTLWWRADTPITAQYNTSLRVVAADGQTVAQNDGPPARGLIPTNLFFDAPRPDPKLVALPDDLPPGRYRLDVAAYDVATLAPLREPYPLGWFTVGPPPAPPARRLDARWEDGVRLVGADLPPATAHPGDALTLRLVWSSDAPLAEDYVVFVHLVGDGGAPLAQRDQPPEAGFYPTSGWTVGEWVADAYTLTIPADAPTGVYQLVTGLYRAETNERLPLAGGGDALPLQAIQITDAD